MSTRQTKSGLADFAKAERKAFVPWVATIPELDEVLAGLADGIQVTVIHAWLVSIYGSGVPSLNRLRETLKQVRNERA